MVRYLLEHKTSFLPPPGGMIVLSGSGVLSMSRTGPGSSFARNKNTDIFRLRPNTRFMEYGTRALLGALDPEEAKTNRYISPTSPHISPTFENFPRSYIAAGGAEILCDESTIFAEHLKRYAPSDDWVVLDIPEDAVHDFCVYSVSQGTVHAVHIAHVSYQWHNPERKDVLKRLGEWIDKM